MPAIPPPQHVVDQALASQSRPVPYPRPDADAPNVVMVVLDDVGFAQLGCFGSGIATPRIDEVAESAVFLCSPSASYITGTIIDCDGGSQLGDASRRMPAAQ